MTIESNYRLEETFHTPVQKDRGKENGFKVSPWVSAPNRSNYSAQTQPHHSPLLAETYMKELNYSAFNSPCSARLSTHTAWKWDWFHTPSSLLISLQSGYGAFYCSELNHNFFSVYPTYLCSINSIKQQHQQNQSHNLCILMTRKKTQQQGTGTVTTNLPMFFKLFNIFHGIPTTN